MNLKSWVIAKKPKVWSHKMSLHIREYYGVMILWEKNLSFCDAIHLICHFKQHNFAN